MTPELLAKTAHFVEVTAAELTDAHQKLAAADERQQKYAAQVEQSVDALIKMGYLKQASRAVAIQTLSDPLQSLDHLVKMAAASLQVSDEDNSRLGTAVEPTMGGTTPAPQGTTKRAAVKRFGAHGDKFVQSLGLDPNNL